MDIDGFYIMWQDSDGDIIGEEWVDKRTYDDAIRSIALRIRQSRHRCPTNLGGFYIMHPAAWREFRGVDPPKLHEIGTQKREVYLQDEMTRRIQDKHGPPPPGFGEIGEDQET
jgi:hypothetical protein